MFTGIHPNILIIKVCLPFQYLTIFVSTRGLICRVLHIYPLLHFICLTSNKILQLYSKSDKNVLCISFHYLYDSVPVNATDMSEE